jgi:CDP-diacylglycerol--glycerol-3-phosphate 3-phosphatidyltransferase
MLKIDYRQLTTLPNLLTLFRVFSVPFLLIVAWYDQEQVFLLLLLLTFVSDVLDGMAARWLQQETELGALLDSWGDILIYTTIVIGTWWLRPELIIQEKYYVLLIVLSYLTPLIVGWVKFKDFTRYHTWLVKSAVASMGLSYFLMMWFGWLLPFHMASLLCMLAGLEEIAISLTLDKIQSNVKTLWHVKSSRTPGNR